MLQHWDIMSFNGISSRRTAKDVLSVFLLPETLFRRSAMGLHSLPTYRMLMKIILIKFHRTAASINTDYRMFRPPRPLSAAYKTVLHAADKGLRGT